MSGPICQMSDQKEDLKGNRVCPVNKEKLFLALYNQDIIMRRIIILLLWHIIL